MANALAILVGLKEVDPACHGGWDGKNGCWGCELDVDNLDHLLSQLGYRVQTLKTRQAKADRVLDALRGAARVLGSGDILVFYFSGHGGQQPDENGDEQDGKDETLVAYNREIIDDELNEIWPTFSSGVRIVMLSDSCNSGTNYRMIGNVEETTPIRPVDARVSKAMQAEMIHIGGCRDGRTSSGYQYGGAFTKALCDVWDEGNFRGNYRDFHKKICPRITSGQNPQYNEYGPVADVFREQKPFTTTVAQQPGASYTLEIPADKAEQLREIIRNEGPDCLLAALEKLLAQRSGSASATCTADSGGNVSCTGTITIDL